VSRISSNNGCSSKKRATHKNVENGPLDITCHGVGNNITSLKGKGGMDICKSVLALEMTETKPVFPCYGGKISVSEFVAGLAAENRTSPAVR
jgi:hypothetical protein